jgi:2,4-dichlorophenol 6-monooxygenase
MPESYDVPVLIVGGGPAGLTAALWLDQRGVPVELIERRDFSQHFPRAHLLNVRTMEVFHDVGVAGDVYAISAPERGWQHVSWYTSLAGPTPLHGLRIGQVPAWGGGPDAERYAQASPRRFTNLPQIHLDRVLAEHAAARFGDRLHARHELVGLDNGDDGVTAEILDREAGHTYRLRARYLVAADGGRTSSQLLGVTMLGSRSLVDVVTFYVEMDLSRYADEESLITYFVAPGGKASVPSGLLCLAPNPTARLSREWSISVRFPVGDPASEDVDAAMAGVRQMLGLPGLDIRIKAIGRWQYEGVVADRFRVGSAFLIGDAAHRHPPTGGLGLNTAVQDAANLGWKLAAVLDGYAGDGLLDTFEPERMAVAATNVEHALRNAGRHAPIGQAMGMRPGQSVDEGWAEIAVWASGTPEGERRRQAVRAAVEHNREDYGQLNIEAGFAYASGAVLDDGTPPPPGHDSATEYVPTARPGHHVPHAWLRFGGDRVSAIDLVALDGLTLFAGAPSWGAAAAAAAAATGCPIELVCFGDEGPVADPGGGYRKLCSIEAGGALLVRPDKHVAWRTTTRPADPAKTLTDAVLAVLTGTARPSAQTPAADRLSGIIAAGERIRTGSAAPARIFESTTAPN